ncbi:cupin domain-containing protein [Paracoccus tegillarcae]|uniref:Cupin type-2 domain-containing protein n=1 Tax=Paracoccus tegillarcae TaxID=1529068 RepID=A0A2K9ED59_9RHOB|nr:cupin domain-containing protein [Paracoccus tegillarcae]AUH32878.1 hypothetical protein CUV01_05280 [Paracoccus tegillarcae]
MAEAIVHHSDPTLSARLALAAGPQFELHEWSGGGPGYLHVHHRDDEAWHVISGRLLFRIGTGETFEAGPGTTVHMPAGVAHDYDEIEGPSRYLMILTPRLRALIEALHASEFKDHAQVMLRYSSEIVE